VSFPATVLGGSNDCQNRGAPCASLADSLGKSVTACLVNAAQLADASEQARIEICVAGNRAVCEGGFACPSWS